jgi:hypothetical protein
MKADALSTRRGALNLVGQKPLTKYISAGFWKSKRRNKMKKASHRTASHRSASHRTAHHSNESLVAAAQTIGSTLGMMVAKVKGASDDAIRTGRKAAKAASKATSRVRTKVRAKVGARRKARKSKR